MGRFGRPRLVLRQVRHELGSPASSSVAHADQINPEENVTDEPMRCLTCGEPIEYPLPAGTTEKQARLALGAVLRWYAESPIREIQIASDVCGIKFPIREIEAALSNGELPDGK